VSAPSSNWVSARVTGAFLGGLARSLVHKTEQHDGLRRAADLVLARFGVSSESLRDVDNRFSHELALALLDEAVRITGDPDLALHVAERVALEQLDLVVYLGRHCDTVRDAFATVFRHHKLIHAGADVRVEARGAETWVHFGVAGNLPVTRQAAEFGMALVLIAVRQAARVEGGLARAVFAHAEPSEVGEHRRIFAAPLEFGRASNALVFRTSVFEAPLRTADPVLRTILERHARMVVAAGEPPPALELPKVVSEVRRVARSGARGAQPTLADVAKELGLSPRTLRRRLAEAGTSYRQQLDDVLAARAIHLLSEGAGSEHAAWTLGFSDASAFRRAFRRWTGRSPASHPAARPGSASRKESVQAG
jgi:AraC-like DNA-binding protein